MGSFTKPIHAIFQNLRCSVKVGDLVKLKWVTFASKRRAKRQGKPVDELGLVVEEHSAAVKVIFPSHGKKTFTFVKSHLEVICD